jgi:hypothetical protein
MIYLTTQSLFTHSKYVIFFKPSDIKVSPFSQRWNSPLLLDSTTDELLFIPLTELEEFFSATDELDFLESFWEDEDAEPLSSLLLDEISPIGSGAELLDSSPQATNKAATVNNTKNFFTEDLLESEN